jgi:two-component system phosphate regulon sensor histidine kinase PhoR
VTLGIRSKLFLITIGLITVSVAVADAYLSSVLDADLTKRVRADLLVRLNFVERDASSFSAPFDDSASWDRLADDLSQSGEGRVTIVRRDGVVLGDSELDLAGVEHAENHADRPEIMQAQSDKQGSTTRWSSTLKQRMMYVAVPFKRDDTVAGTVRLAKPLTDVDHALDRVHRFVLGSTGIALALATLLLLLASSWMSRSIRWLTEAARRMAAGDLGIRTHASGHDELAELGRALDQLATSLQGALGTARQERDLMGRVLEGMREGVLLLDDDGHVALANTALRATLLLGSDVIGKSPLELVRNAVLKRILDEARSAPEAVSGELELGDIRPRRLLVHASALRGEPKGVLAVFVDVTDLRRLETVRRDFVANVSHELRTPVAAVRSAAETLRRAIETQPEAAPDFMEIIERNAERLGHLIEDLLDLSRIESREFKLNVESMGLPAIARHVVALSQDRADAKGLRLSVAIPTNAPAVRADRRALEQVLTNLVDNAVKYCPSGASVIIRAERVDANLRVLIEDTGPGIEAKHLSRLFERFYRVDSGRSRELGGTGLGLSIVKHLVEAMQGRVDVESTPGKGSCFSFTLPLA